MKGNFLGMASIKNGLMSLLGFGEIQIGSRNAWNVKYLSSFELSSTRGHSVTGFGNLAVSSIAKM